MPKTKRNQNVSLTKTAKKDVAHKKQLIDSVRKYCSTEYDHIFVLSVSNMRNIKLKALREQWKSSSRFVFGKNKLLQHALGRTGADECVDNVHKIVPYLTGHCGLLFTRLPVGEVERFFAQHDEYDYARTGDEASSTVELEAGPLEQFAHSIEPHLRTKLNLPVILKRGVVVLERDHTVCKAGEKLTSEQTQVLKLLSMPQAKFTVELLCRWSKVENGGEFVPYKKLPAASKLKIVESKRKRNLRASKKQSAKPSVEDGDDVVMDDVEKNNEPKKSKKTIGKKKAVMKIEKNSSKKEGKFKKSKRMAGKSGKSSLVDADVSMDE